MEATVDAGRYEPPEATSISTVADLLKKYLTQLTGSTQLTGMGIHPPHSLLRNKDVCLTLLGTTIQTSYRSAVSTTFPVGPWFSA